MKREETDADRFMAELQSRWRGANTLQYRSVALLSHAGEFQIRVGIAGTFRRPNRGRLRFDCATWPEAARVRVGNGRLVYDRQQGDIGKVGRTHLLAYRGRLTDELPHPLDEVAYFSDQFFGVKPFLPPPTWGDGTVTYAVTRVPIADAVRNARTTFADTKQADAAIRFWPKEALRLTVAGGKLSDTLYFDPLSFAPLTLLRIGDHAGRIQETLRETFLSFALGALPGLDDPFVWTADDERGIVAPDRDRR